MYANDHQPPHVHVFGPGWKIRIGPSLLTVGGSYQKQDIAQALLDTYQHLNNLKQLMIKTTTTTWVESELARLAEVSKHSVHSETPKPRHAVAARFDTLTHKVVIELDNGADFSTPPKLAQGLGDSSDEDLQLIEISPLGTGLHWPNLDVDLTVDGLLASVFGSRHWMSELATKTDATKISDKVSCRPR